MAETGARDSYERRGAELVGRRVLDVVYWDVRNLSDEPRTWDHGDWHHAVLGVDLATDAGPFCVEWTDTFYPYGVEVFPRPVLDARRLGPGGPEGWSVGSHPHWRTRAATPVESVTTFWETITVGPAHRLVDGVGVGDRQSHQVPVALRLDFAVGPVWLVAGMPMWPDADTVLVPADEILVVFDRIRMLRIGFPDEAFVAP